MKLKRFCAGLGALCMVCAVVPVLPVQESAVISANAEGEDVEYTEGTYENLKYKKYADYVEITGYDGTIEGEVIIPSEIDGLSVTSIGNWAFYNRSDLISITIPDTVIYVKMGAFNATPWLSTKRAENSLVIVNNVVVDGRTCKGDVVIPDGVVSIGEGAFGGSDLTSVIIPDSVTYIGREAFNFCEGLSTITIPNSVMHIESTTFYGCYGLIEVTIPESVVNIEAGAFNECKNLNSITISNPNCEIYDAGIISNDFDGTIYGYESSTAQAYAEKYGYKFALIGSAPDTTESKTEELKAGDANGDGEIDILDVITINKAILGKETLTENGLKAIDFNGNGKPDSSEALTLLKYIVGLITDFHA